MGLKNPLLDNQPVRLLSAPTRPISAAGFATRMMLGVTAVVIAFQLLTRGHSQSPSSKPLIAKSRASHYSVHYSTYHDNLTEFLADWSAPHYVLFTSGYMLNSDGSFSDIPWCPDCGVTLPIVREIVTKVGGSLLEVEVGTRMDWRDPQHPLKIDEQIPIKYVPTLVHWTSKGPGGHIARVLNADAKISELRLAAANFLNVTAPDNQKVQRVVRAVIKAKGKHCGSC